MLSLCVSGFIKVLFCPLFFREVFEGKVVPTTLVVQQKHLLCRLGKVHDT